MAEENDKKTILIVEDEEPMLQALSDTFTSAGYFISQAKNGEEGLALALKVHPSVILIDILMPKMDGLTMLKQLRQDTWGKQVPIIILTNVNPDTQTVLQEVMESQAAYYLVKSDVTLSEILDKVQDILSAAKAA